MGGTSHRTNSSCMTVIDHCTTHTPSSTQDLTLINTSTPNPFYLYLSYRGVVNTYKSISKTTLDNYTAAFFTPEDRSRRYLPDETNRVEMEVGREESLG